MENQDVNYVCGLSGEPINVGDSFIVQTVPAENADQQSYDRLVKVAHLNLSDEDSAAKTADGTIKTRTE